MDHPLRGRSTLRVWLLWLTLPAVAASTVAADAGATADPARATLYRDSWGVPHIYAGSAAAAAYAHGWAQAEDRLEDVLYAYARANGRLSRALGEEHVESDRRALIAGHARLASASFAALEGDAREMAVAFAAGLNDYMAGHPDQVPAWADRAKPEDVLAVFHAFAYAWPAGQARSELGRAAAAESARWSNQWVVGAGRSAEGGPIALIDPHLAWTPDSLFYEVHFHGGRFDFYGFAIPGTPVAALGHTDRFSLAATTGGPDCADVYTLKLAAEQPGRYAWGDGWRELAEQTLKLEVRGDTGIAVRELKVLRSHHGPVMKQEGDRAWAVRTAYDESAGLYGQWVELFSAGDLGGFLAAMGRNEAPPQNFMYADVDGNLLYLRAGRVPRRDTGYRWDRPVPGWTADTAWRGFHSPQDWVQTLNPPDGWMQNCNIAPSMMMPGSPMTAERYRDYLYNTRPNRMNARGRRAVDLLQPMEKMTLDDALAVAMDTFVQPAPRWREVLAAAWATDGDSRPELADAVRAITGWNGRMDRNNTEAALFRGWMRACRSEDSGVSTREVEAGDSPDPKALLDALAVAVAALKRQHGRIDIPYEQFQQVRRGDAVWPVAGCRADGISTLRSVRGAQPADDGISWVSGGQFATTLVVLDKRGVRSYSAVPFGQSNRPGTPHYADQGRQLFARSRLKPTWYAREALLEHLESETNLSYEAAKRRAP